MAGRMEMRFKMGTSAFLLAPFPESHGGGGSQKTVGGIEDGRQHAGGPRYGR